MVNAYWEGLDFLVQAAGGGLWRRVVDTSLDSPHAILGPGSEERCKPRDCRVAAHGCDSDQFTNVVKPLYSVPAAESLLRLLAAQALSRAAGAPLVQGNEIRILKDASEHFAAWLTAIHAASRTVHLENYIIAGR